MRTTPDSAASRALIFHESYLHEYGKLEDERYLLERCKDAEFYSNIRQHTDICTQVYDNSRSSVLLKALNTMAVNTHMCGISPCVDFVQGAIYRIGWQAMGLLALVVLICPNFALAMYKMSRHRWAPKP